MTGIEEKLRSAKQSIEQLLEREFEHTALNNPFANNREAFIMENGEIICIDTIFDFGCLVIEHAESLEDAERLTLEDGGLFYIEDYASIDELYTDMLKEIYD